jgi:hypothetical protein
MKKKLLIISGVIIIVILGIGYYLFTNLDSIAKSLIESVGTKVSGTKVTVGSVKLSVTEGHATIFDLRFANPEGFSNNPMISCGEITAHVNYSTGAIAKIHIGSPSFLFEQKGTEDNFGLLQKHAEKQADAEKGEPGNEKSKEKTPPKEYQIDSFSIDNARVSFSSLDAKQSGEVTINKIKFSKLKGTPNQIFEQIIAQLTEQIIQQVTKEIIQRQIKGSIKGETGDTINKVLNILGQ